MRSQEIGSRGRACAHKSRAGEEQAPGFEYPIGRGSERCTGPTGRLRENKRLHGGMFNMWPTLLYNSSEISGTDRVISVGMLTGHPEDEMSGFSGDLLQELSRIHEQARQAM